MTEPTTDDRTRDVVPPAPTIPARDTIRVYRLNSESVVNIVPALIKARAVFDRVERTTENPHLRSKYADMAAVLAATSQGLTDNGLMLMQQPDLTPTGKGDMELITRLFHESGEWFAMHYPVSISVPKDARSDYVKPHDLGSALTYARRYSALAILGLAPVDDDGNAASGTQKAARQERPARDTEPTPEQVEKAGQYETQIREAATPHDLSGIGAHLANSTSLLPKQKAALRALWSDRMKTLKDAEKPTPKPAGREKLAERGGTLPLDTSRRRKAEAAARAAHPDGLKGAGLAVGLIIDTDTDLGKITAEEFERMVLISADVANDAAIDYAAEVDGA
jgi:hypothetical protein